SHPGVQARSARERVAQDRPEARNDPQTARQERRRGGARLRGEDRASRPRRRGPGPRAGVVTPRRPRRSGAIKFDNDARAPRMARDSRYHGTPSDIPPRLRGAAVGLLALLRNEGGCVGTPMVQTILERREQFHVLRLNEKLDALYPAVQRWFVQGREMFMRRTGDPVRSQQSALRLLQELRDRQALSLAYFDVFWSSAVVGALMVFLVL